MASSYSNPDQPSDESDDGLVILTGQELGGDDDQPMHALPVPIDEYDEADDERRTIDLDASSGSLDLSALIANFGSPRGRRPRPAAASEAPASGDDTAPPTGPVYDLGSAAAAPRSPDDQIEIDRLRAEIRQGQANIRRGMADLANYKRKAEQDRQRSIREATERVLRQLLPIVDDFERSLTAASEASSYDQLVEGVRAILRNCASMLDANGVQAVKSLGMPFDPDLHEAVGTLEDGSVPEETVVEELRKGYLVDDRLLRAALVKISRKPGSTESDADVAAAEASASATDGSLDGPEQSIPPESEPAPPA